MPRIVIKTEHSPMQVGDKSICMCGLSTNQPFCSGAHKTTVNENDESTYLYTEEGPNEVEEIIVKNPVSEESCCGNGCAHCTCKSTS